MAAPDFISDDDMQKLAPDQHAPDFISDEDMAKHEAAPPQHAGVADHGSVLGALDAAGSQVGRNIPVVGPAMQKAGSGFAAFLTSITPDSVLPAGLKGKTIGQLYDYYQKEDAQRQAHIYAEHPIAANVGALGGAMMAPVPGAGLEGIGGVATRVLGNAAVAGADTAVRGGDVNDAGQSAAIAGGLTAGLEALPVIGKPLGWVGKKAAKALAGTNEGSIDRYIANPEAVNAGKPVLDTTKNFLTDADARAAQTSQDSTQAYNILQQQGSTPVANFTGPLGDAVAHLDQYGGYSPVNDSAKNWLSKVAGNVTKDAAENGGQIGLDKGKTLLSDLDEQIETLKNQKAKTQIIKAFTDARESIDSYLKTEVPAYADHMSDLADDTKALTGLTDKFRTDQGALSTMKRVQNGKDPFTGEALDHYDKQFSTNFSDDLKDGYAKSDFEKNTTNGSRRVNMFRGIGEGVEGLVGKGTVSGVVKLAMGPLGALSDVYGGQAVKSMLDAGIKVGKIAGTPYAKILGEAAQRGPQALAVQHYLLSQKDPAYQATQKDDDGND